MEALGRLVLLAGGRRLSSATPSLPQEEEEPWPGLRLLALWPLCFRNRTVSTPPAGGAQGQGGREGPTSSFNLKRQRGASCDTWSLNVSRHLCAAVCPHAVLLGGSCRGIQVSAVLFTVTLCAVLPASVEGDDAHT